MTMKNIVYRAVLGAGILLSGCAGTLDIRNEFKTLNPTRVSAREGKYNAHYSVERPEEPFTKHYSRRSSEAPVQTRVIRRIRKLGKNYCIPTEEDLRATTTCTFTPTISQEATRLVSVGEKVKTTENVEALEGRVEQTQVPRLTSGFIWTTD